MGIDLSQLDTEVRNTATMDLDVMSPLQIAEAMNREDGNAVLAVKAVLPEIAQAIEMAANALRAGGRIIYLGAGTSGRLGILDASECPPTFGVDPSMVVGLIAGGNKALTLAVEGAEDNTTEAAEELDKLGASANDFVMGIAASGRTPYVIYGLRHAKELGAATVALANTHDSLIGKEADLAIEVCSGPEALTGSTRLKAGSTQKMILNMVSTGAMIGIGKAYQNLMVDMVQSNEKLRARGLNIVMEATDCDEQTAAAALKEANGHAKTAIVMILENCDAAAANQLLEQAKGHVRQAVGQEAPHAE